MHTCLLRDTLAAGLVPFQKCEANGFVCVQNNQLTFCKVVEILWEGVGGRVFSFA